MRSFSSTARNRFENRVAEKQKLFQVGGAGGGPGAACLVLKTSWGRQGLKVYQVGSAFPIVYPQHPGGQ